ncbi:DUF4233 domain-containing protein [Demequina capsici]|uniref:DUF4233 domain-containing protein n=1 Tax=Demequina capsici TaxID=3075620 RepID=A0AA96F5F8_9MICO|nr:DUF4233 domain-containing protein [Demequina sp. OYTSA14]WNM23468.1 DUF4233 domain-containing protein [Demequina sp. OYTSA14]
MTETQPRRQRPATLVFTQAVLALQAFVALFAALTAFGLAKGDALNDHSYASVMAVVLGGFVLLALLLVAAGVQQRPWGRWLGWVLQAPMLIAGIVVPAIAAIGAVFLVLWIMALSIGGRIDRERAEREVAASSSRAGGPGEGEAP